MNNILFEKRGNLGILTLNRPQALNALNHEMILTIGRYLDQCAADETVKAVCFQGAGPRAFCAGGDMKAVYNAIREKRFTESLAYFADEYALNRQIFHYLKPTMALMNGIVMGGGYGIGGHCAFRIVSETTIFAMPEVRIGFFPDVGSIYHLLKAGEYGRRLALTGGRIDGQAMVDLGLADVFVPVAEQEMFLQELSFPPVPSSGPPLSSPRKRGSCAIKLLDSRFRGNDSGDNSPFSVAMTTQYLKYAAGKTVDQILDMDLKLAAAFLHHPDLAEGLRAVLIDKDHAPRWSRESGDQAAAAAFFVEIRP